MKTPKETRRNTFSPVQDVEGKRNYKRLLRIERDGSSIESIRLMIHDPYLREEIICKHFLEFFQKNGDHRENKQITEITRDNPWNFGFTFDDDSSFNVEITSIAENTWKFEKNKREE